MKLKTKRVLAHHLLRNLMLDQISAFFVV